MSSTRIKKSNATRVIDAEISEALRAAQLRVTKPRVAVLRELWRTADGDAALDSHAMSHAELTRRLGTKGFDRVTVWRNLVALTEAGLLARTDVGDHTWRFEKADPLAHGTSTHPHFVCVACKRVSCLPEDSVFLKSTAALGAVVLEVQVKGRCDECIAD